MPNPMPESVTDRPTKSHEQVFLLTRSPKYFFDADAVREDYTPDDRKKRVHDHRVDGGHENYEGMSNGRERWAHSGRNLRSVWSIATEPYPDAHFATFPQALVEPCVKAGTSERGCCPVCGAPWEREVELGAAVQVPEGRSARERKDLNVGSVGAASRVSGQELARWRAEHPHRTTGWRPTCGCERPLNGLEVKQIGVVIPHDPAPCVVLDPFLGSGTTALVARHRGRRCIGIELSPEYAELAARRNAQQTIFAETA